MRRLGMWAAGYDCAIVLIGHLNKKEGSKGLYRSLGSIDVVAAARSVLQVERDTENPDIRIVHQIKNSLAPTAEDIRFSISAESGFQWLECRPQLFEKQQPDTEPEFDTEQQKAVYWIKHFLAMILTQKKRSTLRGRQEWNGMMVANIMKNERRWGDLEARKSIVVDYKLGKVTKNNGNRCSAYVPEHHQAIVSPEIARAAHLVASSNKKCGVQDIVVIQQGALKGFVGTHPNWSGINAESIRSLCLNAYLPEEVMKFNMACIRLFEGIKYVLPILHPNKKRLALIMCPEEDSASVEWARQKDENWVNKDITSLEFVENIFKIMSWNRECRYKILGRVANSDQGLCMLFDLEEAIMFTPKPQEYTDPVTGETKKKQIKFFPDVYKDRIGKSYTDYIAGHQMNLFEDFIKLMVFSYS